MFGGRSLGNKAKCLPCTQSLCSQYNHPCSVHRSNNRKKNSLLNLGLTALVMPFGFALCYIRYYILRTSFFTRLFNVEMQQEETEVEEKEEERRKGSKMHELYI